MGLFTSTKSVEIDVFDFGTLKFEIRGKKAVATVYVWKTDGGIGFSQSKSTITDGVRYYRIECEAALINEEWVFDQRPFWQRIYHHIPNPFGG